MVASKKPGPTWKGHVAPEVKARYEAKTYHKLLVRVRQDGADGVTVDQIKHAAARDNMSVNAWIIEAIREKL